MSLSVNAVTSTKSVVPVGPTGTASGGGSVTFGVGSGAAGAYIAQPSSGSLVKKLLAGGVVGAGLGFAASFIPGLSFIPHFKIILPAAGAALGAIAGGVSHLLAKRKANLAMQAQAASQQPQGMAPSPVPGATGGTLKIGSRGPAAKKLQAELKKLGLYAGPINATFDRATAAAVRKYEVMKGVMPTGLGSPDVRAAVTQDVSLVGQYAS